jgi:hypothetical protein
MGLDDNKMLDDHDILSVEVRWLPLNKEDSSNLLVGIQGFNKEMAFRKERNKALEKSARFPILNFTDLKLYFRNGEYF